MCRNDWGGGGVYEGVRVLTHSIACSIGWVFKNYFGND